MLGVMRDTYSEKFLETSLVLFTTGVRNINVSFVSVLPPPYITSRSSCFRLEAVSLRNTLQCIICSSHCKLQWLT